MKRAEVERFKFSNQLDRHVLLPLVRLSTVNFMETNYKKLNSFIYSVKNQNGFNNACYDFFEAKNESINNCYSKKEVRDMAENYPKKYPCEFMIIDETFECCRFYVKVLKIN